MRKLFFVFAAAASLLGCPDKDAATAKPSTRAELKRLSGGTVEILPTAGQLPFCLIFTTSEKGVIRQLTMTRENKSVKCEPGQPIGAHSYRIPFDEGKVRTHVFFSDQKLNAASVAQQVLEIRDNPKWRAMDLRLPGQVNLETLEFVPEEDAPPMVGGVVEDAGTVLEPDAGP
jgi:hypothetical protein